MYLRILMENHLFKMQDMLINIDSMLNNVNMMF
jgi:hypothetical protein